MAEVQLLSFGLIETMQNGNLQTPANQKTAVKRTFLYNIKMF
jgi:hypothetical protein